MDHPLHPDSRWGNISMSAIGEFSEKFMKSFLDWWFEKYVLVGVKQETSRVFMIMLICKDITYNIRFEKSERDKCSSHYFLLTLRATETWNGKQLHKTNIVWLLLCSRLNITLIIISRNKQIWLNVTMPSTGASSISSPIQRNEGAMRTKDLRQAKANPLVFKELVRDTDLRIISSNKNVEFKLMYTPMHEDVSTSDHKCQSYCS